MNAAEFLNKFETAFNKLDDGTNFVSIADLKNEMGVTDQEQFEDFLKKMRFGEMIHLIAGNGRAGGYTKKELDAGFEIGGRLMLYVSK